MSFSHVDTIPLKVFVGLLELTHEDSYPKILLTGLQGIVVSQIKKLRLLGSLLFNGDNL